MAQAIGIKTELLQPGQGRGLIAPEGEGAAGVALGIPVRLCQGITERLRQGIDALGGPKERT